MGFRSLACLLCALCFVPTALGRRMTGSVCGVIVDPSGAVVQDAGIIAQPSETGRIRSASTDHNGVFVIVELPVRHYVVEAEAKGFRRYVREGISVDVNEAVDLPIQLSVGAESQQVQVMAEGPLIQTTVNALGKVVSGREVLDLPLDGRNFSQLGTLQPGVMPLTPGLAEAGGSLRAGQAYAVNGRRPESNNFLIDGANNFDGVDGGFVLKPPIDSIAEFRILTHNTNAEFGHSLSSTTNIITRVQLIPWRRLGVLA